MAKKKATFTFDDEETPVYELVDELMLNPASPYYMFSQGDILRVAVQLGLEEMAEHDITDLPEVEGAKED